jgi:D-tagatose-1,6-bisphosphate aldolase subunit GatZ/KbaZ
VYVIGTEVPVPGGATHAVHELVATTTMAAAHTLDVHKKVFERELPGVWQRVIALVVQPGVEFDHDAVVDYDRAKASQLVAWLRALPEEIVFEAHSTDYQLPRAYVELVRDGFAILKVGPGLTFAMREALDALEDMEAQLVAEPQRSGLSAVIEATMLSEPDNWLPYYDGSAERQKLLRRYSYSDRVRYYWGRPAVAAAVERLVANLRGVAIPESMLSRYLPVQYLRLRKGELTSDPVALIVDRVRDVLRDYAAACRA